MKKILSSVLVIVMILSCTALLFSCGGGDNNPPEGTVTRVTVDVNPSIEFMVDDQNKVVAVTALNDDGAVVIAGEEIIGKTPEEATKLVLEIAHETGYIVDGDNEVVKNEIKISVSGDSKYQESLTKSIKAEVEVFIDTAGIKASIEEVAALAKADLEALALEVSAKTAEELEKLSENELYKLIEESRIETATLLTEEMREAYNTAKNYEINFTKRAEYSAIMEEIGGFSAMLNAGYKAALESYQEAIVKIEEFRYDMLISPESEYQKALLTMREKKEEFLKERQYVASLDINGTEYASAKVTLQASEEQFNAAYALVVSIGDAVNQSIDTLIAAIKASEATLISLEEQFPDDLQAAIDAKATEIEANLNAAKDQFFTDFEAQHGEDIASSLAALEAKKAELKANKDSAAE